MSGFRTISWVVTSLHIIAGLLVAGALVNNTLPFEEERKPSTANFEVMIVPVTHLPLQLVLTTISINYSR